MRLVESGLRQTFIIELDRYADDRGYFARTWSGADLAPHGLTARLAQCSMSFNAKAGTLRGMHYQVAPYEEAKIVRCTRGALYDVVIDLRRDSATYTQWIGVELTPDNGRMLYVPEGCAHGFQTLLDDTEISYFISESYQPDHARGVRWNDPAFNVAWPDAPGRRIMAARDATYPDFTG